jgi:hypothetical protein
VTAQGHNVFELGGVLSVMRRKKWFCDYDSLEDMCLEEFGFAKSKAYDLVRVYDVLIEAKLSWEDFKELGISKLRLLCRKAVKSGMYQDNKVDPKEFSAHAEKAKSMNYVKLQGYLDTLTLPAPANDGPPLGHEDNPPPQEDGPADLGPEPQGTQTKAVTFKLHKDQHQIVRAALNKAMKAINTEYQTVALDHICIDYVSSGADPDDPDDPNQVAADEELLIRLFKKMDRERILILLGETFPDIDAQVTVPGGTEEAA